MKDETLNEIKSAALKELEYAIKYNKDLKRVEELFLNRTVIISCAPIGKGPFYFIKKSEDYDKIFLNCYKKYLFNIKDTDTNKIFVYLGNYYVKYFGGSLLSANYIQVPSDDVRTEYKKYHDLEQYKAIYVPVSKCEKFEEENNIIFDNIDKYIEIRDEFALNMLSDGQENAKKYIKKKYINK